MKANGTLTVRWFEQDGTGEVIFDWDGGPVIRLTEDAMMHYKNRLYRKGADEKLVKGLFDIPTEHNGKGKLGPYEIICIGRDSFSVWEVFVARTDTIAGRLAITRARIEETGRVLKVGFLKILRAWNLARFKPGHVIDWDAIKVVRWIQERIGHG